MMLLAIIPSRIILAQINSGGAPASTIYSLPADNSNVINVNSPDMNVIRNDDERFPSPYRFGVLLPVDISPGSSGKWEKLPDGGHIWRVEVTAPGARAMSAFFDKFVLPEGAKLFLYNPAKSQVIGAFTSANNVPGGYFATELIAGERFIMEYYQPPDVSELPLIHMYSVNYAYRGVGFLDNNKEVENTAEGCEVNVKCPEGDAWQNETMGVMRIMIVKNGSSWWCSGSLLNNVRNNKVPYVLTADHCFSGANATDLQQWVFYFDYESPTCVNPAPNHYPVPKTMTGAKLKSHGGNSGDTGSDFCLVLLNQNIPDTFNVYYNGWNRKDTTSPSGVGIHHPEGDLKKISTYNQPLITANYSGNPNPCHWKVTWVGTADGHGVTEPGSSGSPIFDNHGRIVGALTGGDSDCDSSSLNLPDYYGKFSWSWDKDGSDSTTRLKDWLDPDSTGIMYVSGTAMGVPAFIKNVSIQLTPNPFTDKIQVKIDGMNGQTGEIEVLNLMGTIIWTGTVTLSGSSPISLSFPGLSSGLYFLRVTFPRSVSVVKMIRQ
jgi:hypothetical protein